MPRRASSRKDIASAHERPDCNLQGHGCTIRRIGALEDTTADPPQLCIRTREPPTLSAHPTLWLAELDRSSAAIRVSANLWRSATPLTGRRLVRIVESILRLTA